MTPDRLLDHFDRISDAPDAIPRLRRFILDLAVRGKLVEQDPNDEPASELRKLLNSNSRDTRFDLPHRWIEAKVGELLEFQYGKALPASERLDQGRVSVFGSNGVVGYYAESLTEESAIIIGRKGSAGALNLCAEPSWTTDVAYFVTPPSFFDIQFLFIALQTLDLGNLGKGVKPGLSRSDAYELEIVVPPLAEQHRIVAKVDELMALCDRLEAAQTERESRRDKLAAASLHRLNNGANADEFREHARVHLHNLPRLTTRPEHIQQLRQIILNLGVRGKLVRQDPNDEPAWKLIDRIRAEKTTLLQDGKLKSLASVQPLVNDLPCRLPKGWAFVQLQSLCISVTDGDHLPPPKTSQGIPFLVIGNVRTQSLDFAGCRYVSEEYFNALDPIRRPQRGDVLYTLVGSFGIPIMIIDDRFFCVQRHIGILRPSKLLNAFFLNRALESRFVFDQASVCATGIAQKTVPLSGLRRILIPLPPLGEQQRIVAKVDELLALCDRLKTQLTTTQTESRRLLEAVLHEALLGAA